MLPDEITFKKEGRVIYAETNTLMVLNETTGVEFSIQEIDWLLDCLHTIKELHKRES